MTALPMTSHADYVGSRGPWHFTRQTSIPEHVVEDFYALYRLAFNPLKKLSAARQVLSEAEFHEQMIDARVDKYVAWDGAGEPVGLSTLTRALSAVPWISPEYFAERFPEHWARNAVYYLGFTLTHPSQRHQRFLETIVRIGMDQAITDRAVIAYDVCAYNSGLIRFDERLTALLASIPGARVERLDAQYYSCMMWS